MGQIRKQTIQSSFLIYVGFIVGAINTYFFTKEGLFTPEQYGLTQVITSMVMVLAPMATLGMMSFVYRFHPYYLDNLDDKENDLLTVAILFSLIGCVVVFSGSIIFKPLVVRKFSDKSILIVKYYYWSLVFAFFYYCFMILESYMAALQKTVIPHFLRETAHRILTSILIALFAFKVISFNTFVILFCCLYFLLVGVIVIYLLYTGKLYTALRFSKVTRRFKKSIISYVGFLYSGIVITSLAHQINVITLAGARNLSSAGVFSLNQYVAATMQVPYRGMQSIAIALIAKHWKDKNYKEINRIYQRSSINLLLMSMFIFLNIWINYDSGLQLLGIGAKYATGKTVFLILGIYNILELGTGVNGAILSTSPAWKFEFYSGLLLLAISIPLNIILIRLYGMEGAATATLITFTIYNLLRLIFIKHRFNLWPFSNKTIFALMLAIAGYSITWLLLHSLPGWSGIFARSILFSLIFAAGTFYLNLTPDLTQIIENIRNRFASK